MIDNMEGQKDSVMITGMRRIKSHDYSVDFPTPKAKWHSTSDKTKIINQISKDLDFDEWTYSLTEDIIKKMRVMTFEELSEYEWESPDELKQWCDTHANRRKAFRELTDRDVAISDESLKIRRLKVNLPKKYFTEERSPETVTMQANKTISKSDFINMEIKFRNNVLNIVKKLIDNMTLEEKSHYEWDEGDEPVKEVETEAEYLSKHPEEIKESESTHLFTIAALARAKKMQKGKLHV